MASVDIESLCRNALSANVITAATMQEIAWDARPQYSSFVAEAQRRGYTLRSCASVLLKTLPPDRPNENQSPRIASAMPSISDRDVCKTALNASRTGWDSRAEYLSYKQEAERRKLNVQQCQKLANLPENAQVQRPGSSMPSVTDKDVCRTALNASQTLWDSRPEYQTYKREAEFRGLSVLQCQELVGAISGSTRQGSPASTDPLIISGLGFGLAIRIPNGSIANTVERSVLPTTATNVAAWFNYTATTEKERLISIEIRQGQAVKSSCSSVKISSLSGFAFCHWQTLSLSPGAYRLVVSFAGEDLNATSFVVQTGLQR